jgi:hypothetical protein
MGAPMARNLLHAGHEVTVWNRTVEKARPLENDGAYVAASPEAAVAAAEIVITMLADAAAVDDLEAIADGAMDGLRASEGGGDPARGLPAFLPAQAGSEGSRADLRGGGGARAAAAGRDGWTVRAAVELGHGDEDMSAVWYAIADRMKARA